MSIRTVTSLLVFCFSMWLGASAQPAKEATMNARQSQTKAQSQPQARARTHAEATITVHSSKAEPYDIASPALTKVRLNETFSGDLDGKSAVRALEIPPSTSDQV